MSPDLAAAAFLILVRDGQLLDLIGRDDYGKFCLFLQDRSLFPTYELDNYFWYWAIE